MLRTRQNRRARSPRRMLFRSELGEPAKATTMTFSADSATANTATENTPTKNTIIDLMRVSPADHDLEWLKSSLQAAVELEMATIPPYLCAMWSIKDPADPV